MSGRLLPCVAGILLVTPAWAANFHARMLLKDASNGDRRVGASPKQGIPQGHTLKVAIQEARFGRAMADGALVALEVCRGAEVVAGAADILDATGYCELLILVGDDWTGQHHVEALVTPAEEKRNDKGNNKGDDKGNDKGNNKGIDKGNDKGNDTGSDKGNDKGNNRGNNKRSNKRPGRPGDARLEREFRVIEGEPAPNVPGAIPAALLALGGAMLVLWWRRPQTAAP